jgi:dynein heavy chain
MIFITAFDFQGILNITSDILKGSGDMMSLWKHECYRVIVDRFVDLPDKDWFEKTMKQVREKKEDENHL